MMQTARVLGTILAQRWHALREDEGATTVEYTVLVVLALAFATVVGLAVKTYVTNQTATLGK
jgi:Flp pilus assembly pilin Flp